MGSDGPRRTRRGALAGGLALAACVAAGTVTSAGSMTSAGTAGAVPARNAGIVGAAPVRNAAPASTGSPSPASTATPGRDATPGPGATGGPDDRSPSPKPSASIGKGEGVLRVLTFQGHVEYGTTLTGVDWVSSFENSTGCRVVRLDRVRSAEEMAAKFRPGSYDVVSPPPELAGQLVAEGKVAPIDTGLLASYKDVPERLRELPSTRRGKEVFGVPYLWSADEVLYRGERPKGPQDLYDDERVAIRDTPMSLAGAALALKETRPDLKIDDPFQLTPEQLDAAVELVSRHDGPGRVYWRDSLDVIRAFATDRVRLGGALPYHADLFARAGRPVKALDDAPMTGWADSWMLSSGAASPNCAYRWLDWITSPKAQRAAAAWTGLAPANSKACGGEARRVCDAHHAGDAAWLKRVFFAVRPSKDCGGAGGECTDYTDWTKRWKDLVE
ncbi:extracellular solute-binding protein [Streptosporangium sandarakinum]|uniref:extracellular solute-binding protein n=1 Tax=Streptosporangium sandarakinum TaxID=1260955 RepID=UPI003690F3D2